MIKVACIVEDGVNTFELGVASEVFGDDRSAHGVPLMDYRVVTPTPGKITLDYQGGAALWVEHGLEFAAQADVLVVPAFTNCTERECSTASLQVVRDAYERGATVLTLCTGAFVAAEAGILDGRRATTHWRHAATMRERFPAVDVQPDAVFVDEGRIITSAGTAAAVDASLHLVARLFGARAAATIARSMVVPPVRDGGQVQYASGPVAERRAETLAPLVDWMSAHLDDEHSVSSLARRANLSERTFARRFRDELGTTPGSWLTSQRVRRAQQLLEATDLGLDTVAQEAGFGTAALLRHHFSKVLGTTPSAYRKRFACQDDDVAEMALAG